MKPSLLVMAAGIGSRYGGLKQLDSVGPSGETIIDYSIYDAVRAGFDSAVFIIREEMLDDFQSIVSEKYRDRINVMHVFQRVNDLPDGFMAPDERKKPWGTAHAMLTARNAVDGPFAIINADDMYGEQSFAIMADALEKSVGEHDNSYCMIGFELYKTLSDHGSVARGVCDIDDRGYLSSITEIQEIERDGSDASSPDGLISGNEIVSMNLWGFTPAVFGHTERLFREFLQHNVNDPKAEFYIPTVITSLLEENIASVKVYETPAKWLGVTYREDKPRVEAEIRKLIDDGVYPEKLWG